MDQLKIMDVWSLNEKSVEKIYSNSSYTDPLTQSKGQF